MYKETRETKGEQIKKAGNKIGGAADKNLFLFFKNSLMIEKNEPPRSHCGLAATRNKDLL
jgi:hypothetical protein